MVSKNQQKIGQANGICSPPIVPTQVSLREVWVLWTLLGCPNYCHLPTAPTQVTKTGNVGSVDVFRAAHLSTFDPRGQGNVLRGS